LHQTTITLNEFADLLLDFELRAKSDLGGALSITGRHPDLGNAVVVQDGATVIVMSERPLSMSHVPDLYDLEKAIAQMSVERSRMVPPAYDGRDKPACFSSFKGPPEKEVARAVRGMLEWLGIDPTAATPREIAYARHALAHAREMLALPPSKLGELRAALLDDLKKPSAAS
jgi:hypothetical protein